MARTDFQTGDQFTAQDANAFGSEINQALAGGTEIVDSTYAEVLNLVNTGGLGKGALYRFQMQTIYEDKNYGGAKTGPKPWTIIALAISENKLDSNVVIEEHPEWTIKYDIKADKSKFGWTDGQSMGQIYYMKDQKGNEAHFDFKNITTAFQSYTFGIYLNDVKTNTFVSNEHRTGISVGRVMQTVNLGTNYKLEIKIDAVGEINHYYTFGGLTDNSDTLSYNNIITPDASIEVGGNVRRLALPGICVNGIAHDNRFDTCSNAYFSSNVYHCSFRMIEQSYLGLCSASTITRIKDSYIRGDIYSSDVINITSSFVGSIQRSGIQGVRDSYVWSTISHSNVNFIYHSYIDGEISKCNINVIEDSCFVNIKNCNINKIGSVTSTGRLDGVTTTEIMSSNLQHDINNVTFVGKVQIYGTAGTLENSHIGANNVLRDVFGRNLTIINDTFNPTDTYTFRDVMDDYGIYPDGLEKAVYTQKTLYREAGVVRMKLSHNALIIVDEVTTALPSTWTAVEPGTRRIFDGHGLDGSESDLFEYSNATDGWKSIQRLSNRAGSNGELYYSIKDKTFYRPDGQDNIGKALESGGGTGTYITQMLGNAGAVGNTLSRNDAVFGPDGFDGLKQAVSDKKVILDDSGLNGVGIVSASTIISTGIRLQIYGGQWQMGMTLIGLVPDDNDANSIRVTEYREVYPSGTINNLTTTTDGFALDARQGKVLNDKIEANIGIVTVDFDSIIETASVRAAEAPSFTSIVYLRNSAGIAFNNFVAFDEVSGFYYPRWKGEVKYIDHSTSSNRPYTNKVFVDANGIKYIYNGTELIEEPNNVRTLNYPDGNIAAEFDSTQFQIYNPNQSSALNLTRDANEIYYISGDSGITLNDTEIRLTSLEGNDYLTVGNSGIKVNDKPVVTSSGMTTINATITRAEYDALVAAGTTDPNTLYIPQ